MAERLNPAKSSKPILLEPPIQPGEFELAARHFRDTGQWPELSESPREAVVHQYRWSAQDA